MKPQTRQVLDYLRKKGPITPLQALRKLRCFRLASRVSELREAGIRVKKTMITRNGKRFAEYRLAA